MCLCYGDCRRATSLLLHCMEGNWRRQQGKMVLAKRSSEKKLLGLIDEVAPSGFVVAHDLKSFRGGFWTKTLR